MNEADLLLVIGASFANHTGIYQGHPIIQVDRDPLQLGKFHPVAVPVWATSASPPGRWTMALGVVAATDQRAEVAAPPRPVGGREGQPRRRRPRPRGHSAAVFAALTRRAPRTP